MNKPVGPADKGKSTGRTGRITEPTAEVAPPLAGERTEGGLRLRLYGAHHLAVTFMRPEVHNALDQALVRTLTHVVKSLPSTVRTVLLEGDGPSFCAGADLRGWQGGTGKQPASNTQAVATTPPLPEPTPAVAAALAPVTGEDMATLLASLQAAPQVIVAKVHGFAGAGGAGIVAACDVAIASDDARFRFPEARLGLVPATIAPYVLRAIGGSRTRALFLTGATLSAAEALAAGLIFAVVARAELDAACWRLLHTAWLSGPLAVAKTKALLAALPSLTPPEQSALCRATLDEVRVSAEAEAGLQAFFARHSPPWVP